MTKNFPFETLDGVHLLVEINIICTCSDYSDYNFEDLSMLNDAGEPVDFESLCEYDKTRLTDRCQQMAYNYAQESYQEYLLSFADRFSDSWEGPEDAA